MQWVPVLVRYVHPVRSVHSRGQQRRRLARNVQAGLSALSRVPTACRCATTVLLASTIQRKAAMRVMHAEIANPEKYPLSSVLPSVLIAEMAQRQIQGRAIATRVQRETF
jgi:hypothetical protein